MSIAELIAWYIFCCVVGPNEDQSTGAVTPSAGAGEEVGASSVSAGIGPVAPRYFSRL